MPQIEPWGSSAFSISCPAPKLLAAFPNASKAKISFCYSCCGEQEKATPEASPAKALRNCHPSLALAVGATHLAMASSRSLMACRSRSLASLSSAAPRSRSRSSFSVVISTLSSVTCGQREAVKPRAAQENAPQVCVWEKATWANLQAERSSGHRRSCVCCVGGC